MKPKPSTVAILICAGEQTRWGNYLGVNKHFVEIEGEKLLHRTVRLIKKYSPETEIFIVAKDESYRIGGTTLYKPKLNPANKGADKFLSSKELWNKTGRTVVVWGDVWFSDEAIKTIFNFKGEAWTLFARFGESSCNGCPWGECFAQSFYPADIKWHEDSIYQLVAHIKSGYLKDGGGWEHYCLMQGFDPYNRQVGERLYEIDDFSQDFDFPQDYEKWMDHRQMWKRLGYYKPSRNLFTFCGVFRNEATRVRYVLDVAKYLCADTIVAVQESSDATAQIVRDYTYSILEHPAQSPEESKDEIMAKVKTPWTLWLDADEMPSLALIRFIENFKAEEWEQYDALRFPRINYIDGRIIEANTDKDEQYRLLKSTVRWNPKKQGRRIHIHPQITNPAFVGHPLYHHRTLAKVEATTKRWNELEKATEQVCNDYLKKVKEKLHEADQKL